jgi:hypothetical protein
MAKCQHQPGRCQVTCNANDGTLNRSVPLELNPIASSTRHIRTIQSLGDDAFKPSDRQPCLRDVNVGRMSHQLQARVLSVKHVLEKSASLDEGQGASSCSARTSRSNTSRMAGPFNGCVTDEFPGERQSVLKGAEVGLASLVGDDDLPVEHGAAGQDLGCTCQFGKPWREVAAIAAEQREGAPPRR